MAPRPRCARSPSRACAGTRRCCWPASSRSPTATRPRPPAGILLHAEVPADESPEDPDEYYDRQLVGLAAYDVSGAELGTVTGLVHGGAQDLLAVRTPDGRDTLVPFVKALVPEVDVAGGRVVIADRPGLVTPLPEDD